MYNKKRGILMIRELIAFDTPYIAMQTLHAMLENYRNPRDCISRLVKNGILLRLKNGFFLITDKIKNESIPTEQIANLLYGPSYLSLEYAMSYYGMIPEAVYVRTSITTNRSKNFYTPISTFSYSHLSLDRYCVGISHKENEWGGFSIATPEKALADHVFQLCQGLNHDELLVDLIESKRIEPETLKSLDKSLMQQIAIAYHSSILKTLAEVITIL